MNQLVRLIVSAAFLVGLLGCQTTREIHLTNTFDEESFKTLIEANGTNLIKGSALLRQANGAVQTCAGFEVHLVPVTAYSAERVEALYGNSNRGLHVYNNRQTIKFIPDSESYSANARVTRCNPQGFFSFDKVKDGEYFVSTTILWQIMDGVVSSNHVYTGGSLMQKVSIKDGETVEIVLSN